MTVKNHVKWICREIHSDSDSDSVRRSLPEVYREGDSRGPSGGHLQRSVEKAPPEVGRAPPKVRREGASRGREGASKGREGGRLQRSVWRVPPVVYREGASMEVCQEGAVSRGMSLGRSSEVGQERRLEVCREGTFRGQEVD